MEKFNFNKLSKFKWFVLENFPFIEADFDALTNWQLFCKLGKEMNKIINSENVLGEQVETFSNAFLELKNYVDDYFTNLDVQEEINNKLDEMTEDGTLQEIISSYLNSKAIFGFDNVGSMKESTNLINGSYARTLGYYNKNDGGSSLYKIRNISNDDIIDNASIISLNNNLVAELIILNNTLNPIQFGAKCDGIEDDANIIRKAINFLNSKNGGTLDLLNNKIYTLSSLDDNNFIYLKNNCNIKGNSTLKIKNNFGDYNSIFSCKDNIENIILKDFTIDENTMNNSLTTSTGENGYLRTTFRLIANNYSINNIIFDNLKLKDCVGVWQFEFEKNIENLILKNCVIDFSKTIKPSYDRTSVYLGVKNCEVYSNILNGYSNGNTAIELHGINNKVYDNIINDYNNGCFIVNDSVVSNLLQNNNQIFENNILNVLKIGVLAWQELENRHSRNVKIINNTINIDSNSENGIAIGMYDVFGNNSSLELLDICDNTIVCNNENICAIQLQNSLDTNFSLNNLNIVNNKFLGKFNQAIKLQSNKNNTFVLHNANIKNNSFTFSNETLIENLIFILARTGFENILIENNDFKATNINNFVYTAGSSDIKFDLKIINNNLNKNLLPINFYKSDNELAFIIHRTENIVFSNDYIYDALSISKYRNGSELVDNNFVCKKKGGKWFINYEGNSTPTHIPVLKGSKFNYNNSNILMQIAKKDGFIADHIAGNNRIGEWVYEGLYVFKSKTINNISSDLGNNPTDFDYIGELATFYDIN